MEDVERQGFKRKLTTILSADVEGYSRLMEEDEDATVRVLTIYREVMDELVRRHRGRVVDSSGDNLLAEFASVVDAARCAVEIQQELNVRNSELLEGRRMAFRIGINLGDVIEDGDRVYGDGVNIAARIEALAEGGGICISGTVYDQIDNKLELEYDYLGEQIVKNIVKPVRVYRVRMEADATGKGMRERARPEGKRWRRAALALAAVLALGVAAVEIRTAYFRDPSASSALATKEIVSPLPGRPAIAVLPFVNMSGDPGQDYFSDGITEDVITALAAIPRLSVIARNSTFTYRGKPSNVQDVAKELGVGYVLEGSVQKAGERVRITAQLIDAATGHHLWADRYDRELKDVFALKDEITLKIMRALQLKMMERQPASMTAKSTENLGAYLKLLQGRSYYARFNHKDNVVARKMFEETAAMDPWFTEAYIAIAHTHVMDAWFGWSKSTAESLAQAEALARRVLTLDESEVNAHGVLGEIYTLRGEHEKAIAEGERTLELNPNSADALAWLGMSLYYAGKVDEAIALLEKALRLNPFPHPWYLYNMGNAYLLAGRYEEAADAYGKALQRNPNILWAQIGLASVYDMTGRQKEARAAAVEVLKMEPAFSVENFAATSPYQDQGYRDRLIAALHDAGLK